MSVAGPLRIAAYGFIADDAGSLASAHALVLHELLKRGYHIDFYAIAGLSRAPSLEGTPNYRYLPITIKSLFPIWRWIDRRKIRHIRQVLTVSFSQIANGMHERAIQRAIQQQNEVTPYDVYFAMGLNNPLKISGIPRLSWTQGIATAERRGVIAQKQHIIEFGGRFFYGELLALYAFKVFNEYRRRFNSDLILCGSRWARQQWIDLGVPADRVESICYPIDLERFAPPLRLDDPPAAEGLRVISLGRITPRKRLDLLLDGFELFHQRNPKARLTIVGGFAYLPEAKQLLDRLPPESGVEYRPAVPRDQVIGLMHGHDCLVQSSAFENLGSSVIEAQACGLPVIVGSSNGTQDYISGSSIVFDAYTPAALAGALEKMWTRIQSDRDSNRASLRADSRAAAEQHAALAGTVDHIERVLLKVRSIGRA